mgnify:CR=1 FL=1
MVFTRVPLSPLFGHLHETAKQINLKVSLNSMRESSFSSFSSILIGVVPLLRLLFGGHAECF